MLVTFTVWQDDIVMAALIIRCLVTWFSGLLSVLFILLKVDGIVSWNWFLSFLPLWIYDLAVIIDLSVKIGLRRRVQSQQRQSNCVRNVWHLIASCLLLGFQAMICTYLQYDGKLRLVFAMIPLWCILLGMIVEVGIFLRSILSAAWAWNVSKLDITNGTLVLLWYDITATN